MLVIERLRSPRSPPSAEPRSTLPACLLNMCQTVELEGMSAPFYLMLLSILPSVSGDHGVKMTLCDAVIALSSLQSQS